MELFNGKHGHLGLYARTSNQNLAVRLTGALAGSAEMDAISEIDLADKFLRVSYGQHFAIMYLDVAQLQYVDTFGMEALKKIMRLADSVVIVGLTRGLSRSDLNVVTWLATQGTCTEQAA